MRQRLAPFIVSAMLLLSTGCNHTPPKPEVPEAPAPMREVKLSLVRLAGPQAAVHLVPDAVAGLTFETEAPGMPDADSLATLNALRHACGAQQWVKPPAPPVDVERAFMPLPVLKLVTILGGALIDRLVSNGLERIAANLQAKLDRYTGTYSASDAGYLYTKTAKSKAPALAFNCLRLTRVTISNGKQTVNLDLIIQLRLASHRDVLQIRPLRMYVADTVAETTAVADGRRPVGLAVGLVANTTWLQGNRGKNETVWDVLVTAETVDLNSVPAVFEYPDLRENPACPNPGSCTQTKKIFASEAGWQSLPLAPWSTHVPIEKGGGYTTLTASVAESGVPEKGLVEMQKLFDATKDDIGSLLKGAMGELLLPQ